MSSHHEANLFQQNESDADTCYEGLEAFEAELKNRFSSMSLASPTSTPRSVAGSSKSNETETTGSLSMECSALVCRVCLATEVRLSSLNHPRLLDAYQDVIGDRVHSLDGLPQYLCWECAARVTTCSVFRSRCLLGQKTLQSLLANYQQITESNIKAINRTSTNLTSPLSIFRNTRVIDLIVYEVKPEHIRTIKTDSTDLDDSITKPTHLDDRTTEESIYANTELSDEIDIEFIKHELYSSPVGSIGGDVKSDDDEPLARKLKPRVKREKKKKKIKREKKVKEDAEGKVEKRARGRKVFSEDFATVIVLSRQQQREELHKRQHSLNYTNSPYRCEKCYKGFVDDTAYGNHMLRHAPSSGEFVCEVCEVRCPTQRKLKSHEIAAHTRKYACRACQHVSNTSNQAREHDKWHKGHTYECKLCGESFRKSTTHLTHIRLRHPTEFVCDLCGDSFVGKHGLAVHKKRTHKDAQERPELGSSGSVYCAACDLHFSGEDAWKRHTVTSAVHSSETDFGNGCRTCGEVLRSKEELLVHALTHAKRQATHEGGTCVKCEQCEATFASTRKCQAHFKRMHLGMKYPVKKNVVCEVCGKKCTSNATLAYHQRTHTGEKPFQCSECPKRFSLRQRLQIHERTHTGERPYPCPSCHKAFRHKPALNRHARVHSGAKPYECNYCGKTFSQSNSMKLHVHTVHLKLPPPYRSKGSKVPLASVPLTTRL